MAQLLIRKLDDTVKERLRARAKIHGVSMEEEARNILSEELTPKIDPDEPGLGTRIAALFRDVEWGDEELPQLPRQEYKPFRFDDE